MIGHPIVDRVERDHKEFMERRQKTAQALGAGQSLSQEQWKVLQNRDGTVIKNLTEAGVDGRKSLEGIVKSKDAYSTQVYPEKGMIPFYEKVLKAYDKQPAMNAEEASVALAQTDVSKHVGLRGKLKMRALKSEAPSLTKHNETTNSLATLESLALKLEKSGRFAELDDLAPIMAGTLKQSSKEQELKHTRTRQSKEHAQGLLSPSIDDSAKGSGDLAGAMRNTMARNPNFTEEEKKLYIPLVAQIESKPAPINGRDFIAAIDRGDMTKDFSRQSKITLAAMRHHFVKNSGDVNANSVQMAEQMFKNEAKGAASETLTPLVAGLAQHRHDTQMAKVKVKTKAKEDQR